MSNQQFNRKASLIISAGDKGLDLSALHFKFKISAADIQSPNTAEIRVYNLADETVKKIKGEFQVVTVQAGYEDTGVFGIIFQGSIKQFRVGKESAITSYLDILAADGDVAYNNAILKQTLAAGSTILQHAQAAVGAMGAVSPNAITLNPNSQKALQAFGGMLPRGKVLFGMARTIMKSTAERLNATWSIQNGVVQVLPLNQYLPGQAVVLSALTGVVGIPEQTDEGIKIKTLLNPKLRIGGQVQIDNKSINQASAASPNVSQIGAGLPFNVRAGRPQLLASVTNDGFYKIYVVEHEGDTRGQPWYSMITALAIDPSSKQVITKPD